MATTPNPISDNEKEQIISKLQKLEALRRRAGTEAEAANAAIKIKELLDKHNLDAGVLTMEDKQKGTESWGGKFSAKIQDYDITMAHAVNEIMDTMCYLTYRNGDRVIMFVGLKANVEAAVITFKYFQDTLHEFMHQLWVKRGNSIKGQKAWKSYRHGFADSLYHSCVKVKKARMAELTSKQLQGETMALVHVGQAVAKQYLDSLNIKKNHQQAPRKLDPVLYWVGRNDGQKVQVTGATTNRELGSGR